MAGETASRGPLPKRSMERRRRNLSGDVDRIEVRGRVPIPAVPDDWDPIAKRMYRSLKISGQSLLYEPSDWSAALLAGIATTQMLTCPGSLVALGTRHRRSNACPVCSRGIEKDLGGRFVQHRRPTVRAEMLQAVWKMWIDLNVTETARRRARIEIERVTGNEAPAKVSALDDYRQIIDAPMPADDEDDDPDDDEDDA